MNEIAEENIPIAHIKDYIVNSRKNGYPDSKIIENLKKANWPEDIIDRAVQEADSVLSSVSEGSEDSKAEEEKPKEEKKSDKKQAKKEPAEEETDEASEEAGKEEAGKEEAEEERPEETDDSENPEEAKEHAETSESTKSSDIFTKPELGEENKQPENAGALEATPKTFSFLSLVALLFSPIPFVGLGVSMAILDYMRKNNKSGKIFPLLGLVINVCIILFIVIILIQIFTLEPDKMAGFARFVNDKFSLV
ncbi:hypothetical protein JXC34_07105 [Candidatus Woesearchaeota archaeon]|nr:hypothetical protein [Candidatus Woesearchaeota archaeon]